MTSRLREIRERAEQATDGPWRHVRYAEGDWFYESVADDHGHEVCNSEECFTPEEELANFEFLAHARSDIPWLLAELERTQETLMRVGLMAVSARIDGCISRVTAERIREIVHATCWPDDRPDVLASVSPGNPDKETS